MQHLHLHEHKLFSVSDIDGVPGFDDMKIPLRMMILSGQGFDRACSAIDRRIRNLLHQRGQSAAVVHLAVIDDEKIDLIEGYL
ncbi:hypothetical protein SDC9_170614 [bioreactor metagenome]|uniref:Uncharacterized protein n=1 Tax=bioreactor metagenome TaxID=1076179 RepID=A0A645GAS5_9ZZZZ